MARPRERLPPFSISLVKSLPLPKDLTDSLMEALRLPSSESSPRQLAPGRTPLKRKPPDYAERAERYAMILQLLKSEPAKPLAGRRSPGFGGRKVSGCKGGESLRRAMPGPGAKRVGATENAAPKVGRSGEISDGSVGTSFQKIAGSVGMGPPRERGTEKQDSKSPPISHIDLTSFRRGGSDLRPRLTEKPQNVADPVMPALSRSGRKENGEEVKDAGRRTELWPKDKRVDERSLRLGSRHKEQRGRETLGQSAGVLRRFSNGQQAIHAEETRISSTGYTKAIEEVQVQGGSPPQSPTTQEAALLAELDVLNRQLETVRLSDTLSTRSGSDKHVAKRRFAYVSNDEGGVRQGSEELYKGDVGGFCQLPERRAGIDARAIEAFADAVKATVGKDEKKLEAGKASGRRLVAEGKTGHNLNAGEGKRRDVEKGRTERILSGVGGEKGRRLVVEKEVGTHVEGKEQRIDRGLDAGGNLSVAEGTANDRILSSTSLNGAESNQTTALRDRGFSVSSGPRRRLSASEPPKTPNSHPAKTPDSRAASRRRSESDGVSEAALLRTDEPFPEGRLRRYSDGRTAGCGSASESLRTVKAHRSSEAFHGSAVAKAAGQPRRRSAHGATREERSLGAEQRHSGRGLDREAACRGAERVQKRTGRGARVSPGSALVGETTETESQPVATGSGSPLKAAKLAAHPNTGGAFFQLLEKSRDGHQLQREERGDEERAGSMDGVPSAVASGANGAPEPDQPLCVFVRLSQLAGRRRARSVSDGRHVAAPELRTTAERQRAVSHSGERRVALEESIAEVGENEVQGRGSANCSFAVEWPRDMGDCSGEAARASCDGPVVATGERKRVKEASPERRRAMEPGSGKASDDALRIHHEAEIRIAEETSVDIPEDAWGQFVGAGEAVNTDIMSAEKEPEKSENSTGWSWGHADEEMFLCAERARLRKVKTRLETGSDSAGESRESAPQGGRARRGGISGFWMRVEVDDVKEGMPTQDGGQATDLGLVEKTAESSGSVSNGNGSRNGASVAKLVARFELLWADPSVRDDVSSDVKLAGCTEENEAEAGLSGAEPVWVQWERELLETSSREQTPRGNELEKRGRIPS